MAFTYSSFLEDKWKIFQIAMSSIGTEWLWRPWISNSSAYVYINENVLLVKDCKFVQYANIPHKGLRHLSFHFSCEVFVAWCLDMIVSALNSLMKFLENTGKSKLFLY